MFLDSNESLRCCGELFSAELTHGSDNTLYVWALLDDLSTSCTNSGVFAVRVLVVTSEERDEAEVGVSDLITSSVGTTISVASVKFLQEFAQNFNTGLLGLLGCVVVQESSQAGRLLEDINDGLVVPFGLELLARGLGHVAVLMRQHLKDCIALVEDLAVVHDPDWELIAFAIGAGRLGSAPLFEGHILLLKLHTFNTTK